MSQIIFIRKFKSKSLSAGNRFRIMFQLTKASIMVMPSTVTSASAALPPATALSSAPLPAQAMVQSHLVADQPNVITAQTTGCPQSQPCSLPPATSLPSQLAECTAAPTGPQRAGTADNHPALDPAAAKRAAAAARQRNSRRNKAARAAAAAAGGQPVAAQTQWVVMHWEPAAANITASNATATTATTTTIAPATVQATGLVSNSNSNINGPTVAAPTNGTPVSPHSNNTTHVVAAAPPPRGCSQGTNQRSHPGGLTRVVAAAPPTPPQQALDPTPLAVAGVAAGMQPSTQGRLHSGLYLHRNIKRRGGKELNYHRLFFNALYTDKFPDSNKWPPSKRKPKLAQPLPPKKLRLKAGGARRELAALRELQAPQTRGSQEAELLKMRLCPGVQVKFWDPSLEKLRGGIVVQTRHNFGHKGGDRQEWVLVMSDWGLEHGDNNKQYNLHWRCQDQIPLDWASEPTPFLRGGELVGVDDNGKVHRVYQEEGVCKKVVDGKVVKKRTTTNTPGPPHTVTWYRAMAAPFGWYTIEGAICGRVGSWVHIKHAGTNLIYYFKAPANKYFTILEGKPKIHVCRHCMYNCGLLACVCI